MAIMNSHPPQAHQRHDLFVRSAVLALLALTTFFTACNIALTLYSQFHTVPHWSQPARSVAELALVDAPRLFMLTVCWVTSSIFFGILSYYKTEPRLHLGDVALPRESFPTVDVLLPRYKEPWEMFGPVLEAALALDYPPDRFTVYVCDDGSRADPLRDRVAALQEAHHNLRYVTRQDGRDAKGGNLNSALKVAGSELVAVLDADHVADPQFLNRVLPHLLLPGSDRQDEGVAFVQTRQCFSNASHPLVQLLDGNHLLFYNLMETAFNGLGCAMCVGTGYVMRRAALDKIGGYVVGCAVEDVVTSLALLGQGYRSKFVNECVAIGLSPETLSEFFIQRERWVAGSAQLLVYKNPLAMPGLGLRQRIAYLVGSWYWLLMLLFMGIVGVRVILWLAFRLAGGTSSLTYVALLFEYAPVYSALLLLPAVPLASRLANTVAVFTFIPCYLTVTLAWARDKLNPAKHTYKVATSSEALGDAWPRLAWLNVACVAAVSGIYVAAASPVLRSSNAQWSVPTVFVLWTYLVNAPVVYDVCRRAARLCRYGPGPPLLALGATAPKSAYTGAVGTI